jgi:tetratricopeptide (TPR) repeat protein
MATKMQKTVHGRSVWEDWISAGRDQLKEGELERAVICFTSAAEAGGRLDPRDPRRATALRHLGTAYLRMGKADESRAAFDEALLIIESHMAAESRELVRLLEDYTCLLEEMGRTEELESVNARIDALFKRRSSQRIQPEA